MLLLSIVYASFIQCLIDRYPNYFQSNFSKCDICSHKLNILDLIPILSYIYLKGKCRYCKTKISINKLITEIIFPIIFIVLKIFKEEYLIIFIIFSMLYFASIIDIKYGEIPDLCFVIISLISFNCNIKIPLIILAIGGILSLFGLIGFGDIKILFSLALHLNFINFILGLLISCLLAIIFHKNKIIRFAPYLSIGYLLVIFASK